MSHRRTKGSISDTTRWVMGLAARPQGVCCRELAALLRCEPPYASSMLARQVTAGRAIADKTDGFHRTVYRAIDPLSWPLVPDVPAFLLRLRERQAPVVINSKPNTRPAGNAMVVPDGVVAQQLRHYTHDVRYQLPPDARPFGAGFAAVGIGRDVQTGKEWNRQ